MKSVAAASVGLAQTARRMTVQVSSLLNIMTGVGWSMLFVSFMVGIYYNMIIAYILRYLFASFTTTLPWQSCRPEWTQYGCLERRPTDNGKPTFIHSIILP